MTLGGENSTSTSNLVGFSLGVAQLAPLEMAPWAQMEMSHLHMESAQTCQIGIEISNYTGDKISVGVARRSHFKGNQYHVTDDMASQEQGYNMCALNQG